MWMGGCQGGNRILVLGRPRSSKRVRVLVLPVFCTIFLSFFLSFFLLLFGSICSVRKCVKIWYATRVPWCNRMAVEHEHYFCAKTPVISNLSPFATLTHTSGIIPASGIFIIFVLYLGKEASGCHIKPSFWPLLSKFPSQRYFDFKWHIWLPQKLQKQDVIIMSERRLVKHWSDQYSTISQTFISEAYVSHGLVRQRDWGSSVYGTPTQWLSNFIQLKLPYIKLLFVESCQATAQSYCKLKVSNLHVSLVHGIGDNGPQQPLDFTIKNKNK